MKGFQFSIFKVYFLPLLFCILCFSNSLLADNLHYKHNNEIHSNLIQSYIPFAQQELPALAIPDKSYRRFEVPNNQRLEGRVSNEAVRIEVAVERGDSQEIENPPWLAYVRPLNFSGSITQDNPELFWPKENQVDNEYFFYINVTETSLQDWVLVFNPSERGTPSDDSAQVWIGITREVPLGTLPQFDDEVNPLIYVICCYVGILILCIIGGIILYCLSFRNKKNDAAPGDLAGKWRKQTLILLVGIILTLIGIALGAVGTWWSNDTSNITCCRFFVREINQDESIDIKKEVCFENEDALCFFRDFRTQQVKSYVLWRVILLMLIGLIFFISGIWAIIISLSQMRRLLKPTHAGEKQKAKVTIGFEDDD
eukprot:gb/GECH01002324.1/.p1 GENE.gb/GECH01002324.1/~~gb/GECH01002324.1/.p1  ORF type:complete len:369 (+),score=57.30 gb/GECH01002324.1/:1-1107(+)